MEIKMKNKYKVLMIMVIILIALSSCSKKKEDAKNMEQLQNELGIPVRVKTVELETFEQFLRYNAVLGGIEESTAQAMVSDVIIAINAKVGDRVNKGDIIVKFPINTPAAQYEQASSAFNSITAVYNRMQRLYEQGAISLQDFENVQTQYKVSQANLSSSEQMINVRAPISGVITNIMVNPSEKTHPGQDLFTVASTGGYKAIIMVPDMEISKVRKGSRVTAKWMDKTINGKISSIAMAMDQAAKAFRVEASFSGLNREISFGVTAEINIEVLSKPKVVVVERQHMVSENGGYFVWVNQGDIAIKRTVKVGLDNSLEFEIVEGLAPGDILITEGINMLTENAKLRVIE